MIDNLINFIADNWQLVFGAGAVGTVIVGAIVTAWARGYFEKKPKSGTAQQIRSGAGSINTQAGRDAHVGVPPPASKKGRRS
jgi:hypothetical protein